MILRPYQESLVLKAVNALSEYKNTLAVAATGAGKTIMLAELAKRIGGKTLVLQHREELIHQNESKFRLINPKSFTSFVKANDKDYSGEAVFAMVQTLSRNGNLNQLPRFDHLIIDEAHHSSAKSYIDVINKVKDINPDALLSGFTATPCRGDKKGLRRAGFDNCCDEISTELLVNLGFLVPPVAYTHNLAGVSFDGIERTASGELDMDAVAEVMDVEIHNETIFENWFKLAGSKEAGGRKTIIFCSTISHAENVCMTFVRHGIKATTITGETPTRQREEILKDFSNGRVGNGSGYGGGVQVICNVAVLTEGYDNPSCSCIVLLRPCSAKSTMIQMIGRGLRIDPNPEHNKENCIVLDFGMSLSTHNDHLMTSGKKGLDDKPKICPSCQSNVPPDISECPICGYVWEAPYFAGWYCKAQGCFYDNEIDYRTKNCPECGTPKPPSEKEEKETVTDIEMICVNILAQSPFLWSDLFKESPETKGNMLVASGFESAAFVVSKDGGNSFIAIGKASKKRPSILQSGQKSICLSAADDFLRLNESSDAASKTKRWLNDYPTQKQVERLKEFGYQGLNCWGGEWGGQAPDLTKYDAACHLAFRWNQKQIERILGV